MRAAPLALLVGWAACGGHDERPPVGPDACAGLECRVEDCASRGLPETTVSGTVFAPNGTLPLVGVNVYIPASDPGPLVDSVSCERCTDVPLGGSVGHVALSDTTGHFTLVGAPSGANIPLVIQVGKWRRRITLPGVTACTDNPLLGEDTRLPRNHVEGDIPRIAMTSGMCDALECLLRKLGLDDSEFTTDAGPGRVHLYSGGGFSALADGTALPAAADLWDNYDRLGRYDLAMFSCDCRENPAISPHMLANVKAFADAGGRVFLSHYHAQWISGVHDPADHSQVMTPQQVWPAVATCNVDEMPDVSTGIIDQVHNPKGSAFAQWMQAVTGSFTPGQFPISAVRKSCTTVTDGKAERWVYLVDADGNEVPQDFQFTTPQENEAGDRCGKVVLSDMHVTNGGTTGNFPDSCVAGAMSEQEKALAFMVFDITSCVGPIL